MNVKHENKNNDHPLASASGQLGSAGDKRLYGHLAEGPQERPVRKASLSQSHLAGEGEAQRDDGAGT